MGYSLPKFYSHILSPQHTGTLAFASGSARGSSGCGDAVTVQLRIIGDIITDIKCIHEGCLNTMACADAMAELVKGKNIDAALALQAQDVATELDGLPEAHMHCAGLAVDILAQAIDDHFHRFSYWTANRFWDDHLKKGSLS